MLRILLAQFAAQRESLLAELQRLRAEKAAAAEEAGDKVGQRGERLVGWGHAMRLLSCAVT